VETNRGKLNANMNTAEVATGEAWLACQAVEKGLVDELMTSDEYLRSKMDRYDVIEVKPKTAKKPGLFQSFIERGVEAVGQAAQGVLPQWQQHLGFGNAEKFSHAASSSAGLHHARFEDVSGPR
jgi:ClpP class serine protease